MSIKVIKSFTGIVNDVRCEIPRCDVFQRLNPRSTEVDAIGTKVRYDKVIFFQEMARYIAIIYPDNPFFYKINVIAENSFFLNGGMLFVEDWWGNSLSRWLYSGGKVLKYHESNTQAAAIIRTCNYVYGYNYSSGEPGGGYSWVQAGGCYYMYLPERADYGDPGGGGGAGGVVGFPEIRRVSL